MGLLTNLLRKKLPPKRAMPRLPINQGALGVYRGLLVALCQHDVHLYGAGRRRLVEFADSIDEPDGPFSNRWVTRYWIEIGVDAWKVRVGENRGETRYNVRVAAYGRREGALWRSRHNGLLGETNNALDLENALRHIIERIQTEHEFEIGAATPREGY
jgi:hypothetical protein